MKDLIQIKEISKTEIKNLVSELNRMVADGETDPLEIYMQAKMYSEVSKKILDSRVIKDSAFFEAEKYKGETVHGCKIDFSQTGDRLDYESDEEYKQINAALKARKDLLKQAHDSKKKGISVVDEKSGEVVNPPEIKKESESIMKITFKE